MTKDHCKQGRKCTLQNLVGITGYTGPRRSLAEMEEAIEREAKRQNPRADSP